MNIPQNLFPYFGGKSTVAPIVWHALGQPGHYIEPFFGTGAVLLARPYWSQDYTETVNDKDGHIANVWRSIKFNPAEVCRWADWPVNHADLMARKRALHRAEGVLLEKLVEDDMYHDPMMAGYWIWCASSGICAWYSRFNQMPHICGKGNGIHKTAWRGRLPEILSRLSERLRHVRVVCGDWARVCGGDWQDAKWPTVGIFFDPPYGVEDRDTSLYHQDSTTVAGDVLAWCIERGQRENYRIVLCGYDEYQELVDHHGWTFEGWQANGGYSNVSGKRNANASRERIYFSPHCVNRVQGRLF
jgi:site-specific DNA-adenine methylase